MEKEILLRKKNKNKKNILFSVILNSIINI